MRQILEAEKIGTFSLAGVGMKVPAAVKWQYRCLSCGKDGDAEPKESPEEQRRIMDQALRETTE